MSCPNHPQWYHDREDCPYCTMLPSTSDETFIVAEISKNWIAGRERTPGSGLLAEQFERVINYNAARGYRLRQFQLHRMMTGRDELNETIIAVFEREGNPSDRSGEG